MDMSTPAFVIIGGGLAGCECALALARAGLASTLYEQKPEAFSPAHTSPLLGELVCSNSFRSNDAQGSGVGLLKEEMRKLHSAALRADGTRRSAHLHVRGTTVMGSGAAFFVLRYCHDDLP